MNGQPLQNGDCCPDKNCTGHIRVYITEPRLTSINGLTRLVPLRVEECDRDGCGYYHPVPVDEPAPFNRLSFEEDGR